MIKSTKVLATLDNIFDSRKKLATIFTAKNSALDDHGNEKRMKATITEVMINLHLFLLQKWLYPQFLQFKINSQYFFTKKSLDNS